ncbi:ATP synthase F1 subunit epsilon [Roseofilum sp. BLCC_M154]|uniref:ATP synthase epsilon chain n=1 Tax=Roseofilum acuticapitatum BLCC-M154 TaxID=3022444 RepID=A0ABT7ARX3_9CYAN|nr:ATP synthase F1 subunit epsilon [Roseofilum acuticapitatum]MDJ1169651.1 ATP synthase F1 subunit epsilon [Roseofilum acuticapitatum BLCC-M154]
MTLKVRVIASNKTVWDSVADEVILPSTTGQLGILSGHAPLLSALDIGVMQVRPQSQKDWLPIALMGGFAEVDADEVTILVNGGEVGTNINKEEAEKAYKQAEDRLGKVSADDREEQFKATQALKRARAKFQAAGGMVQR